MKGIVKKALAFLMALAVVLQVSIYAPSLTMTAFAETADSVSEELTNTETSEEENDALAETAEEAEDDEDHRQHCLNEIRLAEPDADPRDQETKECRCQHRNDRQKE